MLSTKDPSQVPEEAGERFGPSEELLKCFLKLKMGNDEQFRKITDAKSVNQVGERFSPTEEELVNHFKNLKMLGSDHHQVCKIPNINIQNKFAPLDIGMRFHPTDEELVNHFLKQKMLENDHQVGGIPEVDIYKFEPWDLPDVSGTKSDEEWYFFCPRHYKYANSMRINRRTKAGFWKNTGKESKIISRRTKKEIGTKKTLIFYTHGGSNRHTQWIMHEYSATFNLPNQQRAFVLCKLKKKRERKTDDPSSAEFEKRSCMIFASGNHAAGDRIPEEVRKEDALWGDLELIQYLEPFLGFTLESDIHTEQLCAYIET